MASTSHSSIGAKSMSSVSSRATTATAAAAAAASAIVVASLVAAPPPDFSAALTALQSVFDIDRFDRFIALFGVWPNKEMVLAGDYAGWCITTQCLDQAFQLSRSELRLGSFSISEAFVGDFSPFRYAFSLLAAAVLGNFFMWTTGIIARLLFTHFDASKCSLPSQLPWPDPPGQSQPFDVPVMEASEEQVARFLAFRGVAPPASDAARRETAAREAMAYMQELWDAKHSGWCHKRYALNEKGLAFPYRAPFMNDWNFVNEHSPSLATVGFGQVVFALEHFLVGTALPLLYLFRRDDSIFYFVMYADMAWETYDMLAMFYRRLSPTGADYTISRYNKAIDNVMVPHHIFGVGFEMMALMAGPGISKAFMAQVLITNHFSGGMMLLAMAVHQTPAMSWPKALLNFQRLVLGSLYATRIVWWGPMSVACLRLTYIYTGDFPDYIASLGLRGLGYEYPLLSPIFLAVFVLLVFYTHFNLDLVQVNKKLLRKAEGRAAAAARGRGM
ncbi:hypothetical protein EMIHUDRAFT_438975 [Emiliania huxleyi CCMP1516]|uniref:TLC domain-containing protein n=2 Tax=Emiliania huxleyi TaxID=2903 RepID=A0A0D3I333_EMIH1|nr:hypothetical protein EMIHUDRAFT_438975 [Emiliania huxleyi CCMP1516]EOD05668.1 hypothetical protein EMIHUDRAFT_438975 [Emiliania huxleyi CCMP1516]|eukprot:XP_005758097.1 hypothetical protein EMIHUDRAFT_438975 [Emiliania huxleyi CCMP1516]